jgi:hypothetical protein
VLLRGNRVQACCRRASDLNRSRRHRHRRERRARPVRCRRCRPGTTRIIPGTWQPPQQVGGGGLRPQACHELLDLVFRSPGSTIEDLDEMCLLEHVTELDEGGEVQAPIGQVVGHHRKPGQQPRSRSPAESGRLGHAQELGPERESESSARINMIPCTRLFSDLPTRFRQLKVARFQASPRTTPRPEAALPMHACSPFNPSPRAARDHQSAKHSIRVKRNRRRNRRRSTDFRLSSSGMELSNGPPAATRAGQQRRFR